MSENSVTKKMSAASFFNENRAIAGFGNSMRAVFTSVRELVENGLDAAERRGTNPDIQVKLRRLSSREINTLLDVKQYRMEKHLDFLQLTCRDNGIGVPSHQIADLFGRVLTGTKYGVIQTRGRFGLGAKMCLLYSMSSVDLPAKIRTRYFMDDITYEMHLMINLEKNEPIIMEQHEYLPGDPNYLEEPGTEVSITFTGAWSRAKNSVKEYFRQLAIITPYSSFDVHLPGDKEGEIEELTFVNVVDDMPPPPQTVRIHPWGCDITQFKAELAATTSKNLKGFLSTHFMGVTEEIAEGFFQLLEIDPNKSPKDITSHEIRRIVHEGFVKAYQEAKDVKRKRDRIFQFDDPKGTALSPLGAGRLRKGLEKELKPMFVEAVTRAPKAYSGHPFVIEAAIGYGGGVSEAAQTRGTSVHDNKIIYRYANRIPLIFGAGNDIITHTVSSIRWNDYGMTRQSDPLAVAVSVVSTKIPFPETSKEYISIVPEIEEEIRLALMQLGRRLKTFLSRAKRRRREHARLSRFVRSAPIIVENLTKILEDEQLNFTDFRVETDRIAAALAHGASKKVKLFMPIGKRLFGTNVWCPSRVRTILRNNNIETVADFLITSSEVLSNILSLTTKDIYDIKLRTISELDRERISPKYDSKIFVSRTIEKRFTAQNGKSFVSLRDALYRRWIQNSYHYFATDYSKLRIVSGLLEKLFESKKEELLHQFLLTRTKKKSSTVSPTGKQLISSVTKASDLKVNTLFPTFDYLTDNATDSLSKDTSVEEFLFQTNMPFSVNYQPEITAILVNYLKNIFTQLCDKLPNYGKTNITKMTPDWTDAYTKNAFHRRKIKTIEDFINANLDDLIVIKELERVLYTTFLDILAETSKSISLTKFQLTSYDELNKDEITLKTALSQKKIDTLVHFLNIPSSSIYNKKYIPLCDLLLKESKFKLLKSIREAQKDKDISHIKIISKDVEKQLSELQIFTTTSFLAFPSPQLKKAGLRKKDIESIKKKTGTTMTSWLNREELLKSAGIVVIEELFYNPPEAYNLTAAMKKEYTEISSFLRTPLIFALPSQRKNSNLLKEVGINCIGRFLTWSSLELADILSVSEEKINEMKDSISFEEVKKTKSNLQKNLSLLSSQFPRLVEYFKQHDMCIQDLYNAYPAEKPSITSGFWVNIQNLTDLSNLEIFELSQLYTSKHKMMDDLKEALLRLKARNIVTLRQFLDLIPEIIETELSSAKERKAALTLYNDIKTRNFSDQNEFNKQILLVSEYDEFHRMFDLPISRVSGLSLHEYDVLRNRGIISIHQLFEYTTNELASFLSKTKEQIEELFNNFEIEQKGTPFFEKVGSKYVSLISFEYEESERFSSAEIISLILSGFDTVDKIFYQAHPLTFSSSIVNWNVIDKFRKLLRSPLTLVTWEKVVKSMIQDEENETEREIEEIQVSTLTTPQLNTLRNNGITKIIDLLVSKTEDIANLLSLRIEDAELLQKNIRISDTGIDLGDLGILKPNIVRLLDEHNIVTIEDLYFSTFKDKWFLEELPWYVIESFKAILNLPLNHISDMLDPEIIGILEEASIFTLLGFMLTSPEILMEKTGIADERFETIKSGLDLADIFGYFSLPVYFLPNLSFKQTETLRENGIGSIAEFILTSPEKLSKLLKNTPSENNLIISSLNTSSAQAIYEHKGIFAFETKLFDKLEQKFLSRDSIFQFERFQTIQELFYAAEEQFYYSNPELWTKISAIQKYLSLPLKIFTEISEFSQEVLEQNDIKYVYQLLFIPDADLTDPVLYRVVSNYSSKIIIMQAFHYFAKLPSTVYNAKYFKRIVQNIENKTLSDVITDTKVIKDLMDKDRQYLTENYNLTLIRSILELPLRITPFFTRIRRARRDEYKDVIIGDVFDINLEEHSALSPFYSRLLEVDSLDRLIMELSIPIASMGLPRNLALKLSKSAINTLIDFYSTPEKLLSEISGFSMKEIREIKEDLTYSDIVAFRSSQAHAIRPAEILSEKQVEDLKDIGILDVEAFYYSANIMGISKIISIEDYKKIRELLSGSIRFVGFLSFEEIKNLEFNEINSVIDLALLNKKELFEITQNLIYQEFHVLDLISFDELAERRIHSAIPLTVCPSIEEDYLEKLTDIGINSVQDFISRMEEIRESRPALVNLDIFREVQLYKSSVAFIGLNNKQIQQLIYSGVSDILSFITEDISTIALILKTSEKVVQSYLDKITPPNLMKKVKGKGVLIENFTALSKGRITSLLRSGKEYVQDLYSHQYQALPTLNVSKEYMSDFLNSCNISVFRIKELNSEEKLKLTRDGIIRLIDLFNCSNKDLKGALGEISKRINLIRRGDFTLSRGAQLVLNEPLVDLLKSLNFDPTRKAVEDLFGYIPESLLQFSETERIEKSSSIVFIEQLISFLCLNILPLPWFDITTKAVLWNNGIEHVIELVSVDVNSIIGIPREVLKEIRLFQKSFNISRNMSETFSNYVDHSLAFPNNAERQFMKFGLSSAILLIDFIPHPLFEFEDIERSIIRIATSNMFKPLTWLTSDLQINVNQLLPLIQNGGSNIVSSLLMLSQDDELHDIHAKLTEVLNKEIIQLNPPEWSISLTDINIIPNPEILERLKAKKITYLDEFLSLDSKLAKDKDLIPVVYPIILSLKSLPLSSVDNLSPKNIERLKKSGIKNLYEFLALPTPLISEIIGVSEESVNNSKTTIDIKSLEDNVKLTGLDITLVPGLSKEAKETLSQYGCVSLVQASNLNLELLPLSVADRTHLKKSTSILLTPITLIGKSLKLKNPEIKKFLDRNIITYSDLLELPQKNWTPSVKTLLTQQKEDSNYLIRNLSNIQKHGIKIEDLGLSNNITTQLQQIGATTIEHLYYLPIDYITGNSKIKEEDILEIRSKLSLNISYLQNLAKETIDFCYEKGFISIIDHLTYIKQFPKTIREEILQSLNLVKSIKELGFTEPVSDLEMFLRNKGFYSYKSLLTSPSLKEQKEVFDAIAPYLFANIRFLDLDPKVMEKMKKAGVNIIADLYFISSQKIASEAKIKVSDITNVTNILKLDEIKEEITKQSIQRMSELFFLSIQDKNFLKSVGIYNLSDLIENNIYEWLIEKKKILQIRKQAKSLLDVSILYYPEISQRGILEIFSQFFNQEIFTIHDLFFAVEQKEKAKIVDFLKVYFADIEGVLKQYIKNDQFIENTDLMDLFSTKVKVVVTKNVIELLTLLYKNKESLSVSGTRILQAFNKPTSSLSLLTQEDVQNLSLNNITSIGDLLIKQKSYLQNLTPVMFQKSILRVLPEISLKKIESDVRKKVQLSRIRIFDAEIKKELQRYYLTMDDLIFGIKKEDLPISRTLANKIQRILDTPICLLLIPSISIKSWENLQEAVKTVEEFYLLSNKELAQILSLKQPEVDKLRYSISKNSFTNYPFIKENKVFSASDIEYLHDKGIKNYSQLFDAKISVLSESIADKVNLFKTLNVKELEASLEDSFSLEDFVYINMNLNNFSLSKKQFNLLNSLSNFIFSKGRTLTQILELDTKEQRHKLSDLPFEYLLLLEKYQREVYTKTISSLHSKLSKQVKNLLKYIQRSTIILLPQRRKIEVIAKNTPTTLGNLLLEDYDNIKTKVQETEFLRNIRNISIPLLMKLERQLTPLASNLFTESELSLFEKRSIFSVEEAIVFNLQSKNKTSSIWKATESLKKLIETDLFILKPITQNKQIYNKLTKLKFKTVYDLLQYCKDISKEEDELNCEQLLPKLSTTKVEKMLGIEQKRFTAFIKDSALASFLRKKNIRTIGTLVKYVESTAISDLEPEFNNILSALRIPLNALTSHERLLGKMQNSSLMQVSDFILVSDIQKTIKTTLTDNEQGIIKSISIKMNVHALNDLLDKKSYSVDKVGLFDSNMKELLSLSGYTSVAHLKVSSELISQTSKLNSLQISRIHKVLETPIHYLNEIIKDNVQGIFKLYRDGIYTLWDLFDTPPQDLSKKCGVPLRQLRADLSKINKQSIKSAEKDQVTLKTTHPFLDEDIIVQLNRVGIKSLQEMLFPSRILKANAIFKELRVKKFMKFLSRPIDDLDIKPNVLNQIKLLGVRTVKEYIVYPTSLMEGKVDLSYLSIKSFKNKLPLRKPKSSAKKKTTQKVPKSKTASKPQTITKTKSSSTSKTTTQKTQKTSTVKTAALKKPTRSKQTTLLDINNTSPTKKSEVREK